MVPGTVELLGAHGRSRFVTVIVSLVVSWPEREVRGGLKVTTPPADRQLAEPGRVVTPSADDGPAASSWEERRAASTKTNRRIFDLQSSETASSERNA
jgi:hypothetical protein